MAKEKEIKPEKKMIKITIDGHELEAEHREFKSGKKGYGCYGTIKIKDYPHRLSLNLIEL
jgi:hypothetical protein